VIHTPGHSPGGIALWEKKTGILLSGDIVYDGPLILDAYHSDLRDYDASMEGWSGFPSMSCMAAIFRASAASGSRP
jgi:glyoxylase-like metal-dependent hydrolase (beta-lactamase superfamily II)